MVKYDIILLCFAIALLMPLAYGADFSGIKYPGDKFTLNGDNFSTQLSKDSKSIYLKVNDEQTIIANSSCKEMQQKLYLICLNNVVIDFGNDIGIIDEKTGDIVPGLNLSISHRTQNVSVTRVFSKKSPLIMETVEVNVTIQNNGKNPASIDYVDVIPDGIKIVSAAGFLIHNGILEYTGNLNPGAGAILEYTLIPVKKMSADIYGNITYTYESLKNTVPLEKVRINTNDTVRIDKDYDNNLNINDNSTLFLTLNNNDVGSSADAELSIKVPKDLIVFYTSGEFTLDAENQSYRYENTLEKNSSKDLEIRFLAAKTGNYIIPLNLTYTTYGVKVSTQYNISIKVIAGKVTASITSDDKDLMGDQEINITGILNNNDNLSSYYNIESRIESKFLNETYFLNEISKNSGKTLFEEKVALPEVNTSTDFKIVFSGKYYSKNNESFNFSATKTIRVHPPSDLIAIYHQIDKFTTGDGISKISVYVENNRSVTMKNIELYEEFPDNIRVIDGVYKANITIAPKRKSQTYTYTIENTGNYSIYNISSVLRFTESDKEIILRQNVKINTSSKLSSNLGLSSEVIPRSENISTQNQKSNITKAAGTNNTNTNTQGANPQVNKKSLWQRFVDWLGSL